jgi:hypothetical protein
MALVSFAQALPVVTNFAAAVVAVTGGTRKPNAGMPCTYFSSSGAAVLYGANKQSKRPNGDNFGRWIGDGVSTTITEADVPALETVTSTEAERDTCTPAQNLVIVCTISGTVQHRVAGNDTPIAGEFKIDHAGGTYTVTFGEAPSSGAVVDFHINDPAVIEAAKVTLVQDSAQQGVVYDFMCTATATANVLN